MRICPNCQTENADTSLFCVSCGSSLRSTQTKKIPVTKIRRIYEENEHLKTEELFQDPEISFNEIDEAMEFERQMRRYKREQGSLPFKKKTRKGRKEDKRTVLVGLIVILAVLVGGILVFNNLGSFFSGSGQQTASARLSDDMIRELTREKEAEKDLPGSGVTEAEEEKAEEEQAAAPSVSVTLMAASDLENKGFVPVKITDAKASSTIEQEGFDNSPIRGADDNPNTSWQEGVDGPGIGETIDYTFDRSYQIHSMTFRLGNWASEDFFWMNNRPETMIIWMNDTGYEVTFPDGMTEYALLFDGVIEADKVHFEISSIYKGSKYDDTCISDIGIYGA